MATHVLGPLSHGSSYWYRYYNELRFYLFMVLQWQKQFFRLIPNHYWFSNQLYLCTKAFDKWYSLSFTWTQAVQYLLIWIDSSYLQWSKHIWRCFLDDWWSLDPNLSLWLYFEFFRYLFPCFFTDRLIFLVSWNPSFEWLLYSSWQY